MLRKNFPKRKAARRLEAQRRAEAAPTMDQTINLIDDNRRRAQAYDHWYTQLIKAIGPTFRY